jgi:hypothetical protein
VSERYRRSRHRDARASHDPLAPYGLREALPEPMHAPAPTITPQAISALALDPELIEWVQGDRLHRWYAQGPMAQPSDT